MAIMISTEQQIEALTPADYIRAVKRTAPTENQLEMLRVHLVAPQHTITASDLALELGFTSFRNVNSQYGKFAGKLCKVLNIFPEQNISILVEFYKSPGSDYDLRLRPTVVKALVELGIGDRDGFALIEDGARQPKPKSRTTGAETLLERRPSRYFTCHWQYRNWNPDTNKEHLPIIYAGSNSFKKRGVNPGDVVYVISLNEGRFYLGGKLTVDRIISREAAMRLRNMPNLYEAPEWIVAKEGSGTPLRLQRYLATEVSKRIQFIKPGGQQQGLFFDTDTHIYGQATRGIRELTPGSAALLDQILSITDPLKKGTRVIVTTDLLKSEKQDLQGDEEDQVASPRTSSGAGFSNPETNRVVELAAVKFATARLKSAGWQVRSVESENIGYDLHCEKGTARRHVEVKGAQGTEPAFIISANEYRRLNSDPHYWIYIVTSALGDKPVLHEVDAKTVQSCYKYEPMSYRASRK